MPEEQTPVKTKKKRGRPKGSKTKKKKAEVTPDALQSVADMLAKTNKRLDSIEAAATQQGAIVARGPGAPTTAGRMAKELMPQIPGPAQEEDPPAERDGKRRNAIHARRERDGRFDRRRFPDKVDKDGVVIKGVITTVGTRQRQRNVNIVRPQ